MHINTIRPAEYHRTGKRGPPTYDINTRSGLGAIHARLPHFQYSGPLATMGLPSLTSTNFKTRKTESGIAIEAVAKQSSHSSTEEEKELLASGETGETGEGGIVKLGVSYDMGWK